MIENPSNEPLPACGISPAGVYKYGISRSRRAPRHGRQPGLLSGTSTFGGAARRFDLDAQVRIDGDGPRPETTGSRDMWQGLSGVVPSAADATIGLACLAMAIAMAMLGRRKGFRCALALDRGEPGDLAGPLRVDAARPGDRRVAGSHRGTDAGRHRLLGVGPHLACAGRASVGGR